MRDFRVKKFSKLFNLNLKIVHTHKAEQKLSKSKNCQHVYFSGPSYKHFTILNLTLECNMGKFVVNMTLES